MNDTRQFFLNHSKIDVYFKQSKDDFVVTEVPLYEMSGEGEHLILTLRKKDLSTWDAVNILSNHLGCRSRDIGYAGLKDKNAMTIQKISVHKSLEEKVDSFEHPQIKILNKEYHNNKIRVGHLKGNKFFIRLKRVFPNDALKLKKVLKEIKNHGMPNYFGVQRFGVEGNNHIKGEAIINGEHKEKNRKLKQMFLNAYQSNLFNEWLSKRIELSKLINTFTPEELHENMGYDKDIIAQAKQQPHPFKIFEGDLIEHYPYGRLFYGEDLQSEAQKFNERDRVPTGLLPGKRVKQALGYARTLEEPFDKKTFEDGSRRYAWVFPEEIESHYNEDARHFEINFFLPKGSYATELIRELIH
jgi:tRNA pseudouridine13 synthase